jgi:hemolysin D|tara:strand:- start:69 stop:1445 length:1377 start_codon:yes stop_codon:yes gene_type:complete
VWSKAWKKRKSMDPAPRLKDEVHFLPSSLALQESPVHPAPRIIQWLIMGFAALTLLWACTGEIDVVATATGKIVPSGKSKIIQSSEVAVVKAIHVSDGQTVQKGEVLVELDTQITHADVQRLKTDHLAALIDGARAKSLLEALESGNEPASLAAFIPHATILEQRAAQDWLLGQYLELKSALEQSDAEIAQRDAEIQAARTLVAKLQEVLPITQELADDYKRLHAKAYIGKHAFLEKEQLRLDQERELAIQKSKVIGLEAAKQQAEGRRDSILAQTRRSMLDLLNESRQRAAGINQELTKAEQRNRLMRLTAPVNGTVQQLAVHTTGGAVTEAQSLMVIVPSDQPVEVEALFENKDIGFVRKGQDVEIKVDTFTFTKYGVVTGKVVSISDDAIEDERLGLVYSARIQLTESQIAVGNRIVSLSPGMSIKAEVKTDKRKVIDYFLSPLQRHVDESLVER